MQKKFVHKGINQFEEIEKFLKEDSWWNRLRRLYLNHSDLEKTPPNLLIMDTASYDMLCQEEVKPENENFFERPIEIIVVPRCGKSEVRFYNILRRFL